MTIFKTTVLILLLILGIAQTIRMLTTMFAWWVEDLKELIDRIKRLRNKDKKEENNSNDSIAETDKQ